jgi:peptidoglycan-N-acetylglucosamine deacetylase
VGIHRCRLKSSIDRRDFVTLLGAGLVSALSGGCWWEGRARSEIDLQSSLATSPADAPDRSTRPLPNIPPPQPGRPRVVSHAPSAFTQQVALTIDDGTCPECVAGYVAFAARTGIHLTFSPNGVLHELWDGYGEALRPLIEKGQVQIGNHTWSHPNLLTIGDTAIRTQIERNEAWIERTFGITARPWFRPPFGKHSARTDGIAGSLGYTRILMWNGTLGDATLETPEVLLDLAHRWVKAGAIVLGHANHPTVIELFDQLQQLMDERNLQPVTLDEMFGTSRAIG